MRLSHRQALLLYALTVLAAVITMIGTGPAAHADGLGQGAPWVASVGDSSLPGTARHPQLPAPGVELRQPAQRPQRRATDVPGLTS